MTASWERVDTVFSSMSSPAIVTQQLSVRCLAPGPSRELEAEFRYDAADPYAVAMTFLLGDTLLRVELDRSVLAQGVTDPAGEGDICLWPHVTDEGRAVVVLSLCSATGELVGEVRTNQLYRFLTRTLALVPLGTESDQLDVDAVVEQLLGSDAP